MESIYRSTQALRTALLVTAMFYAGSAAAATVIRSIGTNAGNLHASGMASVPIGSTTVTFTSPLPAQTAVGAVGMGDVLVIQGETLFIASYDSPTQVTLQSAATVNHTPPTATFTVTRAFNTLQAWENARDGNLVGLNSNEVGVAYKDGPFTETLTIDGSTTDSSHFMHLTVAPGQRHNGTAGTGVVLDGQVADRMGIEVLDDYTLIEWFDLKNHHGATGFPNIRVNAATNVLIQYLLVRDYLDASSNTEGIAMRQGQVNGMTVRNSIIFNGDAQGIEGDDADDTLIIQNCTIYNMAGNGIDEKTGTPISVTNTISMGNGGLDFDIPSGTQSYNMSEDGTASCGTCLGSENPLIQFATLGSDFHLAGTSTAINAGTDLSGTFCCDIDQALRPAAQWDIGADEFGAATAVKLISLAGSGYDREVHLSWETASELENLGFHLYRSTTADGPYERITATAIPGLGSSPNGAKYSYVDAGLVNGVTYYYKLEDIETSGRTKHHGPVSATPQAGASASGGPADDDATSRITYGDPSANSLRITSRGRFGVTLELSTEGFFAEVQKDGSVRLQIPSFETHPGDIRLEIPVKRSWVEAVAGRKVELLSVSTQKVEAFSGLRPSDAALYELEASAQGTVRARRKRGTRGTTTLREEALYPAEAASVVSVGFQGDLKKALVELSPLRWDRATGQLVLARRLVVRLSFLEREPSEFITKEGGGRSHKTQPSQERRNVVARLGTKSRGLYSVHYEEIMRGRRGVPARDLRLSRHGEAVPYHLEGKGERFAPGSVLYFMGEGASANPFGEEAVYELEVGPRGEAMTSLSAAPSGEPQPFYWHQAEWEENRYYQAALVDAPDVWLWESLFAPVVKSYSFHVSALAPSPEAAKLSVWLQGTSDFPADPDHHLRVYVNGSLVHELRWDGKLAQQVESDLAPGLLREGNNVLELESAGDTEASYSMVMLDKFAVEYPRVALPADGRLEGRWSESGSAELSELGLGTHVLDTSEARPIWMNDAFVDADGRLSFRVEAGHRYLAVSPEATYHPSISIPGASRLKDTRNRADYLAIGPQIFLDAATSLLQRRRDEGLTVKAIPIEEIYSEFGFGESTPEAVKDFLSYAYHQWRPPSPRYVLLLGDATYDFKNNLQTGVVNRVPPRMVRTSYLWTASDPSYAMVNGDDLLPDLAIGRLPAATVDEVHAMVDKILAYEMAEANVDALVVLVADDADEAGEFEADADRLASGILTAKKPTKIYLSRLGAGATRSAILRSFDEGASLVSYIGHGGIHLWADENFFNTGDIAALAPQPQQPLLLTMNCLNGYFHFPYFDSLAEALVKAEAKGAVAAFSPSGLSLNGPASLYHEALLEELVRGGHQRLGDAILDAQEAYAETGAFPELLTIYHLIGDPALMLR